MNVACHGGIPRLAFLPFACTVFVQSLGSPATRLRPGASQARATEAAASAVAAAVAAAAAAAVARRVRRTGRVQCFLDTFSLSREIRMEHILHVCYLLHHDTNSHPFDQLAPGGRQKIVK